MVLPPAVGRSIWVLWPLTGTVRRSLMAVAARRSGRSSPVRALWSLQRLVLRRPHIFRTTARWVRKRWMMVGRWMTPRGEVAGSIRQQGGPVLVWDSVSWKGAPPGAPAGECVLCRAPSGCQAELSAWLPSVLGAMSVTLPSGCSSEGIANL